MATALVAIAVFLTAVEAGTRVTDSQGILCKECLDIANDAQDFLSSPHNLESAIDFVKEHGCASVPAAYKDKCNEMSEEYVPVLFSTLQEYLTPQKMCLNSGICGAAELFIEKLGKAYDARKRNNCALCRYLVLEMKVKLQDPKIQEKLIEFLLENCQRLHNHEDECKLLVLEYGPQVLANLEAVLDDDEICAKIGMCSALGRSASI